MINYRDLYKTYSFKKDLFSESKVKFRKRKKNKFINQISKKLGIRGKYNLSSIVSKNPNSEIYRLSYKDKKIILKVEKISRNKNITKIFNMFKKINVDCKMIKPISIDNGKNYILHDRKVISFYPYINGTLFKGTKKQIFTAIDEIIDMFLAFSKIHDHKKINNIKYFQNYQNRILNKVIKRGKKIDLLFKTQKNFFFSKHMDIIISEWNKLSEKKIYTGKKQIVHFDIHPHNILMKRNKIERILDLSSIKYMPVGYALSYSFLKILRQHLSNYKTKKNFLFLVKYFIKKINKKFLLTFSEDNIHDLAMCEILRRIVIILERNLNRNDKSLNHIMPVLINNMIECKILFNEQK